VTLPEFIQGPISAEFDQDFFAAPVKKKKKKVDITGPTCGNDCTGPKTESTCGVANPPKKKKAQDFFPAVAGWSEPPVTHV
jgi:hypothetical protein